MDAVTNWVQKTTCHGFVDLYDSKNLVQKLFWGAVIIAAFGAIVYYQLSVISYYSTIPTATKISKITTERLEFPLVTICKQHPINMQKYMNLYASFARRFPQFSLEFPSPYSFLAYISFGVGYYTKAGMSILHMIPFNATDIQIDMREEPKYQLIFNSSPPIYDFVQFLNDTSHSCNDIFARNVGDCRMTSMYFDCCNSATPIRTDLGNCYEIRPVLTGLTTDLQAVANGQVNQLQPGSDWGMYLLLQYDSSNTPNFPWTAITNEGYEIIIGEQMTKMDTSRVTVGPNQQVSVYLSLQRYEFDPTITTCVPNQADLTQTENGRKSVLLCKQECLFNATISRAGCVPVMPNMKLNSTLYCSPMQMLHKFYTESILSKNYTDDIFACQQARCPKLCSMNLYIPFAVYSTVINKAASTAVNIYYGELSYTLIVEKPLMDLAGLISSFGGNLGLFAGMSLITIVQFFAHLIQGCGAALVKRNKQKAKVDVIAIYDQPATGDQQKNPEETVHPISVSHPVHHAPRPIHL